MVSAGCIQILLTYAKAQERRSMLSDGFSIGYIRLGTRLHDEYIYYSPVSAHALCLSHDKFGQGCRVIMYRRSGNFHVKNNWRKKISS